MGIRAYRVYNAQDPLPNNTEPPRYSVDGAVYLVEFITMPDDGLPTLTHEEATILVSGFDWQLTTDENGDTLTP